MSRSLTKVAFSKFIIHFFDFLSLKATLGILEKSFFSSKFHQFSILKFLIFQKLFFSKIIFFEKIFFENRVMKKMSQKVFGSNFSKNKYFYLNPKAYEQA